jgi:hypothetical protein
MADDVPLGFRELDAALTVLRREQATYLPSPRQNRLYRAFNVSAFATIAAVVLALLLGTFSGDGDTGLLLTVVLALLILIAVVLAIATLVLFILNWGLMRKLRRHARLRRRLKLAYYFAPAFSAERRQTRFGNFVTGLITVFGVLLAAVGILGIAGSLIVWLTYGSAKILLLLVSELLFVAVFGVGVGLASLHFVRRGKQRLEVVLRLHQALEKHTAGAAPAAAVTLSADEYDALAGLEREQIIRDRTTSIIQGRKESASTYVVQTSREMHDAKSKLPPDVLAQVERAITTLVADPGRAGAVEDPASGNRAMPVAGTPLKIRFDVDQTRQLVRLHDLNTSGT